MKKILFTTGVSLLMMSVNAQITVTSNDYTLPVGATNAVKLLKATQLNTIQLPAEGDNKLWNYSNVSINDSVDFFYDVNTASGVFASSSGSYNENRIVGDYALAGSTGYITKNDSLVKFDGYKIVHQIHQGVLLDSIVFPAQNVVISGNKPYLGFNIDKNYNRVFTAIDSVRCLIYDMLGVTNGDPGFLITSTTTQLQAKGWGKVILPISLDTLDAILVRRTESYSTSFEMTGSVQVTGVSSGTPGTKVSHFLVAKGYKSPVAIFDIVENGTALQQVRFVSGPPAPVDTTSDTSTSIGNINLPAIKAYPNPTSSQLTFDLDASKKYTATVYDINGRLIVEAALRDNKLDVQNFYAGSYIVYIKEDNIETGFVKFIKQ